MKSHAVWIDLRDTAVNNEFRWSNGELITPEAANWAPGQPDNYQDASCTVIVNGELLYDDRPCTGASSGVLCQRFIGLPP